MYTYEQFSKVQARSQHSGNGQRVAFSSGLKIGVLSGGLQQTSIFKIIMIDDVTL